MNQLHKADNEITNGYQLKLYWKCIYISDPES